MWGKRLARFILVGGVAFLILMGAKALSISWQEKLLALPASQKQAKKLEPLTEKVLGITKGQAQDWFEQIKIFPQNQIKKIKSEFDQQFWGKLIEVENGK